LKIVELIEQPTDRFSCFIRYNVWGAVINALTQLDDSADPPWRDNAELAQESAHSIDRCGTLSHE